MNGAAAGHAMSSVDLAWLRMEKPTNPMIIVGVLTMATPLHFADIRLALIARLSQFERLRQKPIDNLLGARWEPDPDFNFDDHLRALMLAEPAEQAALERAVSDLASTPLDIRKPLWQFHFVERYRHGSALILRIHHCYADGMVLIRVLLSLTDSQPNRATAVPAVTLPQQDVTRPRKEKGVWLGNWLSPAFGVADTVVHGAFDLIGTLLRKAARPDQALQLAKDGIAASSELAKIGLLSDDPATPLKAPLSTRKNIAWAPPLPLLEVKTISKALDCTINDALLATVAGALGSYLREQSIDTDDLKLRCLVPVNLRSADTSFELGNCFGLVFVELPVGQRNPLARLFAAHQQMEALKHSPQATVVYWLLTAVGSVPQPIEDYALDFFSSKASAVVSNVIGPAMPLYFAGAQLDQQFFWVPQAGSIGIGISMLTYNQCVHFGVMADANLISDPHALVTAFTREYEKLVLATLIGLP